MNSESAMISFRSAPLYDAVVYSTGFYGGTVKLPAIVITNRKLRGKLGHLGTFESVFIYEKSK